MVTAALLGGCATQPSATTAAPPATTPASPPATPASPAASGTPTLKSPSAAPTPSVRTIVIELADGKVKPSGERVNLRKGEPFVLDITSDRDDEVHVHGFDAEVQVKAGKRAKLELTADRTGRYEVESHHPALLIVVLQIR